MAGKKPTKILTAFRIDPALKAAAKRAAKADGRSLANLLSYLLAEYLKEKGYLKP